MGIKRKIIGGGLSGLAAAINFAKNDEEVEIHEARDEIGMQFHPNYQVLLKDLVLRYYFYLSD